MALTLREMAIDIQKWDHFDGGKFFRLLKKMQVLFTILNIVYVLYNTLMEEKEARIVEK